MVEKVGLVVGYGEDRGVVVVTAVRKRAENANGWTIVLARLGPVPVCDDAAIEYAGFDTLKSSNTLVSIRKDVITENIGFDTLRFRNPATIHDIIATKNANFETVGNDADSTTTAII
ncbi:hypothetical protein U1Q18_025021 [Sarracenia purpurea var. burkii]